MSANQRPPGWTRAKYERCRLEQGGRCAICRRRPERGNLCQDHDDATKTARALLCNACNLGIGQFGEDIDRLEAAALYLRAHGKTTGAERRQAAEECRKAASELAFVQAFAAEHERDLDSE